MKTLKVILFGPLFTQAERIWNRMLKNALEAESHGTLAVTLPQDEAVKFIHGQKIDMDGIADSCVENAESYDVAIAILDGPDADSGTCVEIAYRKGYNRTLPVIGIRTDFRASEDGGVNLMLSRGRNVRMCDTIVRFPSFNEDVCELVRAIIAQINTLNK